MKRFFCFLLILALTIVLVPANAQAVQNKKTVERNIKTVELNKKLVALTFDDGPHSTLTEELLDGLKERGIHVTFFMQGCMAQYNMNVVRRAYDEGHEVANHTWDHPDMTGISTESVESQISRTNDLLDEACGEGTHYLVRPPYGSTNENVREAISAPLIQWSVDTNDWQYGYDHVYEHIISNAYDGAIILCHDIHSGTIPAALDAIDVLTEDGYEFVTVSELYRRRGVAMQDGIRYYECKPTGTQLGPVQPPEITYSPVSGGVRVTITSPSDAPVYYTTDGSRMTQRSSLYTGSFVVTEPCTVQAVAAFNMNGGRSDAVTQEIEKIPCAAPIMQYADGMLTLSTGTAGASVFFTGDASTPTEQSEKYTEPIALAPGTVIHAVSGGSYFELSEVVSGYYSERGNFYTDVMPGIWYTDAVDQLAEQGIMSGVGGHSFAPDDHLTRGMLVTMLYRAGGGESEDAQKKACPFTDVPPDAWYNEAVEWAYRNDIVDGYPGNLFKPDQAVTRQELAKMIDSYFLFIDHPLPDGANCRHSFDDGNEIAFWAQASMNAVVGSKLMQGDPAGNLRPTDPTTRAEFATLMVRMMELIEKMEQKEENMKPPVLPFPTEPPIYILPTEATELIVMGALHRVDFWS